MLEDYLVLDRKPFFFGQQIQISPIFGFEPGAFPDMVLDFGFQNLKSVFLNRVTGIY